MITPPFLMHSYFYHIGVYVHRGRIIACVKYRSRSLGIGSFDSAVEAARAYDAAAAALFEDPILNFLGGHLNPDRKALKSCPYR